MSADFSKAVSGDDEGKLLLWNLETGGSQPLDGHSSRLTRLAVSARVDHGVSGDINIKLLLLNLETAGSQPSDRLSAFLPRVVVSSGFSSLALRHFLVSLV